MTNAPGGRMKLLSVLLPALIGGNALGANARAPVYAWVELTELPTMALYHQQLPQGRNVAGQAAVSHLSVVKAEQSSFGQRVQAAGLNGLREIYRVQRVFNGILYLTPEENLPALRALSGVHAVHLVTPKTLSNAHSIPFIGVPQLWANAGLPLHGEAIRVGVIDTGIDYTHANFGGPGTVAAFKSDNPNIINPGPDAFPTAKVVGGTDFAGATYDASNPLTATPTPDPNPIDESGHGSHVAGTIAGFGVNTNGTTYTGTYDLSLNPTTLRIGPGAAPKASLYALKVFGDNGGSTTLDAQALEWAVDPNGDGDPSDHLDVVNLSLGSPYGTSNNADATIFTNAVAAGVVVVVAAGNESDIYFVTGSPATTPEVISVAATSIGDYPGVKVNSPASIAGVKQAGTAEYGPPVIAALTGNLVAAVSGAADGGTSNTACTPITNGAAMAGHIAVITRGTCSFESKTLAAQIAGATAVLMVNNRPGAPVGMAGDATITTTINIPTRMVSDVDGAAIMSALGGGAVSLTMDDSLTFIIPAEQDEAATFTSRGPTRLENHVLLKPDIAAPGVNIVSTGFGTGSGSANFSGTSMATPLTAGVATLLRQLHPTWTPAQIKALLMNTANHDTYTVPAAPRTAIDPGRVGAGRIDAAAALGSNVIAFDKDFPDRVSVTFNTLDVTSATTESRTLTLSNTGGAAVTFNTSIDVLTAVPGATVSAGSGSVTVPDGGSIDLTVQLAADPAAMTRAHDATVTETDHTTGQPRNWLSETSGYVVLTPQGTGVGPTLRVPYFAALNPASQMNSSGQLATHGTPTGTASLFLQGTGVNTLATAPAPNGVVSLVTPFELAYSNALSGIAEINLMNIQHVGVTSNLPDQGSVATSEIYFAVSTYGLWGSPSEMQFNINIKQSGAPNWQWILYNADLGATSSGVPGTTATGTDVPATFLVPATQTNPPTAPLIEDLVNGISPTSYFAPIFLSDVIILPVTTTDLGLTDGATAIDFQVFTFTNQSNTSVDASPVLHYDLAKPAFATKLDPKLTNLSADAGVTSAPPIWSDLPQGTIPVTFDLTRTALNPASGVLLIHHNNGFGQRAEVVPAVKAQQLVTVTPVGPGTQCPNGGEQVNTGYDDNNNGVLDPTEVTSTYYVCNGASGDAGSTGVAGSTGPTGSAGPAGPKGGCASVGDATSVLALLGLVGLVRRRRKH